MSISGALSIQEVRGVLESLRDEMRPLVRNKAELWKGEVVEVIGSSVRVSRGDEPTTAGSLLRQPYPVVGSIPSVGAEVWAASWVGGGIVITGGTSGAVGVTSIEGQSGTVDIAGTGGIAVSGTGGTVTIDGSGVSGGSGGGNAYTTTTASFTMPANGVTVGVNVGSTAWMATGMVVYVDDAGYFSVNAIGSSTSVSITNLGYTGNASSGTTIASGNLVTAGGLQGTGGGSSLANTIEGVSNSGGNIDVVGSGGITVTGDDTANTITIDGSGVSGGGGTGSVITLGSNVTVTSQTHSDVTGLSFAVTSGQTYRFDFLVLYDASATLSGPSFSINGPAFTELGFYANFGSAANSAAHRYYNTYDTVNFGANTVYTSGNVMRLWGVVKPSANGTVILRAATEDAGQSITVKSGSSVTLNANGSGVVTHPAPFAFADPLVAVESWPWPITKTYTVRRARVKSMTAPATTNTIFAIKKNGTSLGTVTVNAGATTGVSSDFATGVVDGDYLNVECTQVHASTMGTKYTVVVELEAAV